MTFERALLVLILLVVLVDLYIDIRAAAPKARRQSERENAARGVAAASQTGLKGEDAARYATQYVLDALPKVKARHARMLVEHAVSELSKEQTR